MKQVKNRIIPIEHMTQKTAEEQLRQENASLRKQLEERQDNLYQKVLECLRSYTMNYTRDEHDEALALIDRLTPPGDGTIENGVKEMELLTDEIATAISESCPKQEIEQKPDFEAIAKSLHPDSTVERVVFDGPHRLNHDSPAYVADQWRIETARSVASKAMAHVWDKYVSPLQSRIVELEQSDKEWRESHDTLLERWNELLDRVKSLEAENEELKAKLVLAAIQPLPSKPEN